jgi:hypothetical protein
MIRVIRLQYPVHITVAIYPVHALLTFSSGAYKIEIISARKLPLFSPSCGK